MVFKLFFFNISLKKNLVINKIGIRRLESAHCLITNEQHLVARKTSMSRRQTIQIYLPAGDPRGMRVAEITTRIVRVIEVTRSQLAEFVKTPEALQVDVYFLMGELSEAGLPRVYIGQSGSVGNRLAQHNQNKDFWNRALVVISLTNSLTQTHALFLEWVP